ncbi:MAG: DoxX family membrane protein [Corynebacterium sp.]|nr:DoxX family membrane protein [Corynebacterium sp.]
MTDKKQPDRVSDFDEDVPAFTAEDKQRAEARAAAEAAAKAKEAKQKTRAAEPDKDDNATIAFDAQQAEAAATASKEAAKPAPEMQSKATPSAYDRYKRAQPQRIPAASRQPVKINPEEAAAPTEVVAPEETIAFDRDELHQVVTERNTPAASAPTDVVAGKYESEPLAEPLAYDDRDFAPAAGATASVPTLESAPEESTQFDAANPAAEEQSYDYVAIEKHARGTIDFGIFILRLFLAAWLILDSIAIFFSFGAHEGVSGLEAEFILRGYQQAELLAILVPSFELAAGIFLLCGVLSPLAAAVAVAVTGWNFLDTLNTTAEIDIWQLDGQLLASWILLLIAIAIQFTGPGRISVDTNRSWVNRPLASAWIFFLLGLAGAAALWWYGAGDNPIS